MMHDYDVIIIGGGASGTALLFALAEYTDIGKIALIEKCPEVGSVNSSPDSNSQSLHIGDIEMHYTRKKAEQVKPAATMLLRYIEKQDKLEQKKMLRRIQKMALAVGSAEVEEMQKRYKEFEGLFPNQKVLNSSEIAIVEPKIMEGRDPQEPILALYDPDGHAVNYKEVAQSFVNKAREKQMQNPKRKIDTLLGKKVQKIEKLKNGYRIIISQSETYTARSVVVDADSYSLGFAKSLGYGSDYTLVAVGARFYYSPEVLRGKVYPMQDKKLPFAGIHGDPDVLIPAVTRWGPTATFYPVLENGKWRTLPLYTKAASLFEWKSLKAFLGVTLDKTRFRYFLKNLLYEIPCIGKHLFVSHVRRIVPTVKAKELKLGKGVGGMRLQRINVTTGQLEMGEGKIIGENIIFNMTPSPGASVCLSNAYLDAQRVIEFFGSEFRFEKQRMEEEYR